MKDAKVNMNRPPLSEDDINKARDFDQLMQMNNEPPIKIKWGKIGGIVAVVVGLLAYVFWPTSKEENEAGKTPQINNQSFNQEFFDQTNVAMTDYKVNADHGDTIVTPTGTRVIIPAGAFKDEKGNPVIGEVTISFREFHDVPSIFGSNVDMTYDSAGVERHFESAGMVELYGYQNGKEVSINQDKPLIVELASQSPGDYFNIYYMDPNGDWEYVSKDTAKLILQDVAVPVEAYDSEEAPIINKKLQQYEKAKSGFEKQVKEAGLIIPQAANDELFSVKLKYKESQFPELKGYENVLFEVTGDNNDFDPNLENEVWSDIEIAKPKDNYIMTLFGIEKVKLIVRPVFASVDMEEAQANFEELFAAYDAAHQGILSTSRNKMTEAYKTYKATQDSVINVINQTLNQAAWSSELEGKKQTVKRVFEVDNFGFWNSDCPQNLPKGQEVSPVFVNADEVKDTLTFENLYIAEYNKNAFYTYWGNWGHKKYLDEKGKEKKMFESPEFTFNPESETVLWAITNKGELAVITPEELKKVSFSKGSETTIKMKLHKKIISVDKIKEAIGWK